MSYLMQAKWQWETSWPYFHLLTTWCEWAWRGLTSWICWSGMCMIIMPMNIRESFFSFQVSSKFVHEVWHVVYFWQFIHWQINSSMTENKIWIMLIYPYSSSSSSQSQSYSVTNPYSWHRCRSVASSHSVSTEMCIGRNINKNIRLQIC